ncbi:MAG TPA: hypothetical protein VMY80_15005 [Anaerolineae bacterium]|nr:hypothetical protein [Anaerolineae bacterium]
MLKRKSLYVVLGAVSLLAVLLGAVGVAYAQGPQPPLDDRPLCNSGSCDCGGRMAGGLSFGMRGFSLVDATAETTGLTVDEVIAALQEGQTFAEIAQAQGVEPQAIVDAFLADRQAALEQAVADGRLTQEQADEMLAEMTEHVSVQMEQTWMPRAFGGGRMGRSGSGGGSEGGTQPGSGTGPRGGGRALRHINWLDSALRFFRHQ